MAWKVPLAQREIDETRCSGSPRNPALPRLPRPGGKSQAWSFVSPAAGLGKFRVSPSKGGGQC